jgi:hypothetical protein
LGKGKKKQEWEGEIADLKTTELIFVAGKYSIHSFPFYLLQSLFHYGNYTSGSNFTN